MTYWLALRRLLPLLAVLSLALTPVTASTAAAGMRAPVSASTDHNLMAEMGAADVAGMAMDDMPCCPHEKPAMPDCSKACPLMALCLAKVVPGPPISVGPLAPTLVASGVSWDGDAAFASLAQVPPSKPPRA
ncbi:hypothetical protein QR78_06200 [Methylobacterium indicum]|uniref:Uncharacterized protein n=1 Tax=Methylobacterium indicum TaxID=1775910 RepID=A0ABR5HIP5_9HYPH|nr:hypothetical protein [Methylobacterium indicum]KMO22844.1 hypothetical protein QR78_06200 [Methylobacterium indicum]KMO26522.1 hypothetical protein QR79_01745 [Methylobacterium indicum]